MNKGKIIEIKLKLMKIDKPINNIFDFIFYFFYNVIKIWKFLHKKEEFYG